ncbi:hypothetical protein GGX14DRAFT_676855 [Mycena pura]|uniref:Uncharacterized protein n=1 Tax=Mycena pura TaxID=153505 RepID=A0AAD6Y811_9AGAR|nr:hypothetical protein GGX14DRAFT_676855 [Mycena pura]
MSNGSSSAYLLWALLSVSFFSFMLVHLWNYDRFKCLRWDSGQQPGAFKRVMTYSYFATVPLLMVFSVAMTALKYKEVFVILWRSNSTVLPRPFAMWQHDQLRWILPLYFMLSIAWSLELVTHLEELTFWLFLLHQGPRKREWFHSWEFRAWYLGSMVAILGMPLTTLLKRHNIETCEAWILVAGASAGTFTTVCFLHVLFNFPGFIRGVKAEGAEPDVVVRLATFYHLNQRFLFTVPLLILGLDGLVDGSFRIVASPAHRAVDIFLMMGSIGCFISSALTMLIFFPRSMTSEAGYKTHALSQPYKDHEDHAAAATSLPDYERHEPPSPKSMTSGNRSPQPQYSFEVPPDAQPRLSAEEDALPQPYSMRPPSGSRSDDTVWDGARKPAASTSTSQQRMLVHGTPIYVEQVSSPLSPPHLFVHPYVSSSLL